MAKADCIGPLVRAGIDYNDAVALRRIAMTLHRWHERECGGASGCIERDETTGRPYWVCAGSVTLPPGRWPIADRESGAKKRLAKIMSRYPGLTAYIQTDPRGASLYILRSGDVPDGRDPDSYYSRGLAVYK